MLKAYAVALVLTSSAPTTDKVQEGVKAPVDSKPATTQAWKSRIIRR